MFASQSGESHGSTEKNHRLKHIHASEFGDKYNQNTYQHVAARSWEKMGISDQIISSWLARPFKWFELKHREVEGNILNLQKKNTVYVWSKDLCFLLGNDRLVIFFFKWAFLVWETFFWGNDLCRQGTIYLRLGHWDCVCPPLPQRLHLVMLDCRNARPHARVDYSTFKPTLRERGNILSKHFLLFGFVPLIKS